MKKGFTLIELLVVIILIGILAVIVMNSSLGLLNRSSSKLDDSVTKILETGANAYCELTKDDAGYNVGKVISLKTLATAKFIPNNLKTADNDQIDYGASSVKVIVLNNECKVENTKTDIKIEIIK